MNLLRNLAAFAAVLLDELLVRLTARPIPQPPALRTGHR